MNISNDIFFYFKPPRVNGHGQAKHRFLLALLTGQKRKGYPLNSSLLLYCSGLPPSIWASYNFVQLLGSVT